MNESATDTPTPTQPLGSTDVIGWLAGHTASLETSGLVIIPRLPIGELTPAVTYEGPRDDDEFLDTLNRVGARVAYTGLATWTRVDTRALARSLRRARSGSEEPFPGAGDTAIIDDAAAHEDEPAEASIVALVDGMAYVLRCDAAWSTVLDDAVEAVAEQLAEADGDEDDDEDEQWRAELAAKEELRLRVRAAVVGMVEALQGDETFLVTGGSETARRNYAQRVLRDRVGVEEIPLDMRRGANDAAETAWSWWRTTGKPARERALRARLPDLSRSPELSGTLGQRRSAAKRILNEIDQLAVSTDLIDELARASL